MKIGTLIYRSLCASWTTENVGAMWTTKENLVYNIF